MTVARESGNRIRLTSRSGRSFYRLSWVWDSFGIILIFAVNLARLFLVH